MIGAYLLWDSPDPGPDRAHAFAGALRTGLTNPTCHRMNGALLCDGAAPAQSALPRMADGTAVLFTGFISNRPALRSALGAAPVSDAALYAAARSAWGDTADTRVLGEYAAILIPPHGGELHILRSPIFAPTLHIWHDTDRCIVASTAAALFATGEVTRELDEEKLSDGLFLNYCDERRGWFTGVTRLPRGARARITRERMHEETWYRLDDIAPLKLKSDADYVEAADALFAEATDAVLDGFDTPLVSLSGGYDSQAVAAYAMRSRPGMPLLSATSVPQADWRPPARSRALVDERPHVEALAEMYPQLHPHWVDGAGRDLSHHLRDMFDRAMAPPRNVGNLHWAHDIRQLARREGADVVLTGAMGNLTFSYDGTGYLPDLFRTGHWLRLARELWLGGPRAAVGKRAFRQAVLPVLPPALQKPLMAWRDGPFEDPLQSWSPLRADYARESGVLDRAAHQGFDPFFLPIGSVREFRTRMMSNAVNEAGDITGAIEQIHGVPMRDPTRHRPFLEFCFAIPPRQYLNDGVKRWLAKRLLAGKVPDMVLNETRRGQQAADWSARMRPARAALLDELEMLARDPDVAGRIDTERLRRGLEALPEDDTKITKADTMAYHALTRGVVSARFIGYLKGRNDI
ncbi:Putative asparagine synthetase [glutamine-hydrolyzing] [Roseibaca ekhonensis]|uniref:asparagine synthase (glutamine-hydrolyzing) n=1 Tax=Roseinatronobacter ekhonensis TaxID=254356 RepID=A0A3B0MAE0_9RHOB|nr:asparagine synthase C-terminal domain-containing protein [Roseibaca ekhonensis]SUZ32360.1 Putative asparagine synthetase [glutamine-hydrolyzing] [Roseibaca ekhonensis]